MPAVVGVVTLVALIGLYMTSGTSAHVPDAQPIKAEAGVVVPHRAQFNYAAPPPSVTVQAVAPTVIASVKTVVHATVQIQAPVPVVQTAPTPPPASTPQQDPAVSACLGVFAGKECSFGSQTGTCQTLAFNPLTCVPH